MREVSAEEAQKLKTEAEKPKTVLANLHLIGFAMGTEPCAVDIKNGRIIRIRPLHLDWKYKPEEIKLPLVVAGEKVFTRPHLKTLPSYQAVAYKKRIYSPNRVRYPLKRVDFDHRKSPTERNQQNRGVSGFVRISWEEAFKIIEDEIKRIKDTYGLYSVLVFADGHGQSTKWSCHGYAHTLFTLLGGCVSAVRNPDSWEGWYYGTRHFWGFPGPEGLPPADYVLDDILENSELIITNADPATTGSGFQGQFNFIVMFWFREAGKRIIWITPELNYTCAALYFWVNGGKWIPILPNTDAALYLAIAYVWITEGTYDKKYIETHTYGFEDFKKYVLGEEDGVPKTPKWAEQITGIPSRTIKALARLWASKRTSIIMGFGGPKIRGPYASEPARLEACLLAMQGIGKPGVQWGRHISMLNFFVDRHFNIDPDILPLVGGWISHPSAIASGTVLVPGITIPGGGVGAAFVPKTIATYAILNPPISWYGTTAFGAPKEDQFVQYIFPSPGYPEIRMIWNENSCLSACWNPGNKFIEAWRSPRIEFYVGMGVWLENDLLYADLVLPNQSSVEHEDLCNYAILGLFYCDKAIESIGESKNNYEIYCELAKRFGILDKFTGGRSTEEWFRSWFDMTIFSKQLSWDEFSKERKYALTPYPTPEEWRRIKREKDLKPFMTRYWELPEGKGMGTPDPTPTGKIEFKSVNLEKYADLENYGVRFREERPPVPHFIPYGKAYQESLMHPRSKKYPLIMQSNHPRWR
ncbi:MAG: molybdopterin-dependent oxidoreductase, partial [Candidatus Bathyarchaeia archaeon]